VSGELGKSSLDLEANLVKFEGNIDRAGRSAEGLDRQLGALAAIADVAEKALNDVGIKPGRAAESRVSAEQILSGVKGIGEESRAVALELDRVKLSGRQADETEAAALRTDRALDGISRNARQARRRLEEVKLAGRGGPGLFGVGRGVLLPGAIGLGALAAPAAAPGALGLLASIPTLAAAGVGALGTLALAFHGVGAAIGGDKKAFDDLSPAAKKFALEIRSLDGWFDKLRQTAGAALFPGLSAGLHSALSPGTVSALSKAVTELGRALGAAGAQWGRYLGSKEFDRIFGPLMRSAARNIGRLSDTFLHLFDALGVVARAAIPFTNWLVDAADKGSRLFDSWIRGKAASGALAHGMDEARSSLTLVWHLLGAVVHVVGALGSALYPLARVAVRDLTGALNYLAGVIDRNRKTIRAIVGGALAALRATVVGLVPIVGALFRVASHVAQAVGGWKHVFEAVIAIKFGLVVNGWTKALEKLIFGEAAAGDAKATGGLLGAARGMRGLASSALDLVGPFAAAVAVVYALDKALKALTGYDAIAKAWGSAGWFADNAGHPYQHPPGQKNPYQYGTSSWVEWQRGYEGQDIGPGKHDAAAKQAYERGQRARRRHHHHHHRGPRPGTHAWYMQILGYDPTQADGSVFGKPPPFTKNTGSGSGVGSGGGSGSVQPQSALNLEALAGRQDQQAAALGYAGKRARKHLELEIVDLQKADRILEEKLAHAHGRRREELYKAITANLKKIAEARKRLHDALAKARQAQLNFALDQAKADAANAVVGSKAYDRAIAAEEKALRAEIRYWDKRARNAKLGAAARDAALRKELSYERQLHALEKQTAQAIVANQAQFIQSWNEIQKAFGSNVQPVPPDHTGKMATRLYEAVNELRHQTRLLKQAADRNRFPGSELAMAAATAAMS
jgi:hypothetical protein